MQKPAETDNTPQDYESMNLTNAFESSGVTSTGTGTRDSLATTSMSETTEKSNSRWTEHEVKLVQVGHCLRHGRIRVLHQENNTLLGWLETLESARVARNARSS